MIPEHCKIQYTKTVIYWKVMPLTITKKSYWDGKSWHNLHPGKKAIIKTFLVNNKYYNNLISFLENTCLAELNILPRLPRS